ncbi:hypothetical protein O6P43_032421 [Quillaja saponaria]|uniref:Uncharacterized protein n=1 Tax=Quillaja saponaria TaxID=32244 RepID=A0AAD7KNL6_QUISA|nr:hypothetical protein O6P43_032421 [Quillaja saponaria]
MLEEAKTVIRKEMDTPKKVDGISNEIAEANSVVTTEAGSAEASNLVETAKVESDDHEITTAVNSAEVGNLEEEGTEEPSVDIDIINILSSEFSVEDGVLVKLK